MYAADESREIDRLTDRLLREADARYKFPTPVDDIVEAQHLRIAREEESLFSPSVLAQAPQFIRERVRGFQHKLLACLTRGDHTIHLSADGLDVQKRFWKCHEAGHDLCSEAQVLYLDSRETLSPTADSLIERETNYAATRLLFQGDIFQKEARGLSLGFATVKQLGELFGASIHSTLWLLVETTLEPAAWICDVFEAAEALARNIPYSPGPALSDKALTLQRLPSTISQQFNRLFDELIADVGDDDRIVLREPGSYFQNRLDEAGALLLRLLPILSASLNWHTYWIALVDVASWRTKPDDDRPGLYASGSNDVLSGVIFLSPRPLRSPWTTAEAVFHEACHQKLYDLFALRDIYRRNGADRPVIHTPWNPKRRSHPSMWTIDKAFLGFHVYVHTAVLYTAALSANLDVGFDLASALRRAQQRGEYLGSRLLEQEGIGEAGIEMVHWLGGILKTTEIKDAYV